ncbi:MAG: cytochrome c maturation protein CcmE [Bacteroidia bacterium]
MKRTHIIGIILIALAIGMIMTSLVSTSKYASFTEASKSPDSDFHVVGKWDKEKGTNYSPQENANLFVFYMTDIEGVEKKVLLHNNKPQDFEKSEQVVVVGKMRNGEFQASETLVKCPSKYNDNKPVQAGQLK